MSAWIHGANPIERLQVDQLLERVKKDMEKDSQLFQNMVNEHMIQNPHRITLGMVFFFFEGT